MWENFKKRKLSRIDKVNIALSLIVKVALIVAIVVAILFRDWTDLYLSLLALFLVFLPNIVERTLKIFVPTQFEIAVVFFIYASVYLGEAQLFWLKIWWWDLFLHFFSGIIMAVIGFSLINILNAYKVINIKPLFVVIFSFCFALSMGAIWEVFEFFIDLIFNTNLQRSGLVDTMSDIILDILGALTISIFGYLYLKKNPKIIKNFPK